MSNTYSYLMSIAHEMLNAAACGASYSNWSDDFARTNVREVWTDTNAPYRKRRNRRVSISEIKSMSTDEWDSLGIRRWDEQLRVLPLWMYNYVADGERLTCIDGKVVTKGTDAIDDDVRGGCIAYGFIV